MSDVGCTMLDVKTTVHPCAFVPSATYTGDERALSEEDKRLINKRPDNIPVQSSIIDCIEQDVVNNTFYRLKDYYSRYYAMKSTAGT